MFAKFQIKIENVESTEIQVSICKFNSCHKHTLRIFMNNNLSFADGYISILHGMRMTKSKGHDLFSSHKIH